MESSISLDRSSRHESVFREVNERIREVAGRFGVLNVAVFVCECGRADCSEAIELELGEYDALRSSPSTFAMVPGHETKDEQIVARKKRYNVVRVGEELAARLHERSV